MFRPSSNEELRNDILVLILKVLFYTVWNVSNKFIFEGSVDLKLLPCGKTLLTTACL